MHNSITTSLGLGLVDEHNHVQRAQGVCSCTFSLCFGCLSLCCIHIGVPRLCYGHFCCRVYLLTSGGQLEVDVWLVEAVTQGAWYGPFLPAMTGVASLEVAIFDKSKTCQCRLTQVGLV